MDRERESTQKVIRFINQIKGVENLESISKAVNGRMRELRPYKRSTKDRIWLITSFIVLTPVCSLLSVPLLSSLIASVVATFGSVDNIPFWVALVAGELVVILALYFFVFYVLGWVLDKVAREQIDRQIDGYIRAREQTRIAREERRNQREQ